jgi:glycosyltransferase involved in cell wall biosynthesis
LSAVFPSIAYFALGWPESAYPNGIVTYVANLRRALQSLGCQVHVLAGVLTRDEAAPGIHGLPALASPKGMAQRIHDAVGHRLAPSRMFGRRLARAASALAASHPFDLFEIEESFGVALPVQRALDVPVVVRLHGPWFLNGAALGVPRDRSFAARDAAEGRAIAAADAVSAPSTDVLERVREHFGIALENAQVIPNPGPIVGEGETWSLERSEEDHVLFVGRFDRHKGGDIVLRAFARLAARRRSLRLSFVGPDQGFRDDGGRMWSIAEYLEHVCDSAEARDRMTWHGPLPRERVDVLRRRARVTIVASRYETFAMTVCEAMACGSPLVTATAGAIPELIRADADALTFEPGDCQALALAVESLLDDPESCVQLGRTAREHYCTTLAPAPIAARTLAFYREVLDARRARIR